MTLIKQKDSEFISLSSGERIKILRVLLGIPRYIFAQRHKLNVNTLTSIELNRLKLSLKQLQKIASAFNKEGLEVSAEWLYEAKGETPKSFLMHLQKPGKSYLEAWASSFIKKATSKILTVENNLLSPIYSKDDLVGGLYEVKPSSFEGFIQKVCIVEDADAVFFGIFDLEATKYVLKDFSGKILYTMSSIEKIAEVVFHIKAKSHQIACLL